MFIYNQILMLSFHRQQCVALIANKLLMYVVLKSVLVSSSSCEMKTRDYTCCEEYLVVNERFQLRLQFEW
jgi:hypothetical protein